MVTTTMMTTTMVMTVTVTTTITMISITIVHCPACGAQLRPRRPRMTTRMSNAALAHHGRSWLRNRAQEAAKAQSIGKPCKNCCRYQAARGFDTCCTLCYRTRGWEHTRSCEYQHQEQPSDNEIGKGGKGRIQTTSKSGGKGRAIPKTRGGGAPVLALPVLPYATPSWAAAPPPPVDRQRSRSKRTRRQGRIRRRAWEQLFDVVSQSQLQGDPR